MKPNQEELVRNYIKLVYYFAKRWTYTVEDCEDAVQETYVKALKHYDTFTYLSENQLKSWLLTICRNYLAKMKKSKQHTRIENIEEFVDDERIEDLTAMEINKEEVEELKSKLDMLDSDDKDILTLRFYEELPFKEISVILSISDAAVKMRCYRAIQKLKGKLI